MGKPSMPVMMDIDRGSGRYRRRGSRGSVFWGLVFGGWSSPGGGPKGGGSKGGGSQGGPSFLEELEALEVCDHQSIEPRCLNSHSMS